MLNKFKQPNNNNNINTLSYSFQALWETLGKNLTELVAENTTNDLIAASAGGCQSEWVQTSNLTSRFAMKYDWCWWPALWY